MTTRWLGIDRIELDVCDSTNDEAATAASRGARHGTVIIARQQRAGRGRLARTWYSPADDNVYLSCVLRPEIAPARVPPITLAAGVAVATVVNESGADASLKWPNDVLVGGRKIAGILTEMATRGHHLQHVITGIGVNLATRTFPPELADVATSLALAGASVAREPFIDRLLGELEVWFDRFLTGGVPAIADPWLDLAGLRDPSGDRGRRVQVTLPTGSGDSQQTLVGRAIGIDPHGHLCIMDDTGQTHRVVAGDIAFAEHS